MCQRILAFLTKKKLANAATLIRASGIPEPSANRQKAGVAPTAGSGGRILCAGPQKTRSVTFLNTALATPTGLVETFFIWIVFKTIIIHKY